MKTVYYIVIAGIFIISVQENLLLAQSSWEWQHPMPQGADMFAVFTLSPDRAIITGAGGTMMTTTNKGHNWHIQRLQEVDWVRQSSFISETEGWIIGNWHDIEERHRERSKIFKTLDGGMGWDKLDISIDVDFTIYTFNDIEFINKNLGFLLANPASTNLSEQNDHPGIIYKTDDGGTHWIQEDIGIPGKYYQIVFVDSLTGFLLSQPYYSHYNHDENRLHRTDDGGQTWTTFAGQGYRRIQFINEQIGWAGKYRTTDGGQSWEYQSFTDPPLEYEIDRVWFVNDHTGYAISNHTILKTPDGGKSWLVQEKTEHPNAPLQDIQFYDVHIGYAAGYGGTVYITQDGGENWIRYGEGQTENLWDIDFADAETGWAVGSYGTILHTKNGGNVWEIQSVPGQCNSVHIRAVDFLDTQRGWTAGGDCILVTDNGGIDWKIQFITDVAGSGGQFRDIVFTNELTGFAVGQEDNFLGPGFLYITYDGGVNWQRVDDGSLPPLAKIDFVDEDYGWISGSGILLSTKDGGKNWIANYPPNSGFFRYIQFTDRKQGWVSAIDEGHFFRTTNGGQTWTDIPYENRFLQLINSFFFFDENYGIAASFIFNNILSTKDGGQNWTFEERLPPSRLNAMTFVSDSLGWAVGQNGAILRFQGSYFGSPTFDPGTEVVAGNYPNPFNRNTTVYFFLSQPQEVTISIYDVMGKRIEMITIANTTEGKNEIEWQTNGALSSGVYLARIQSQKFTTTIKVLFIR